MFAYRIVVEIAIATIFLPLILSAIKFRAKPVEYKWLGLLILVSAVADYLPLVNLHFLPQIGNSYVILEFVLLTVVFSFFIPVLNQKRFLLIVISAYAIWLMFEFGSNSPFGERNSLLRVVSAFYFLIVSLLYYFRIYNNPPTASLNRLPSFWIVNAVLVYFTGNLFLYVANLIVEGQDFGRLYVPVHSIFLVARNLIFGYGLILVNRSINAN